MEQVYTYLVFLFLLAVIAIPYWRRLARRQIDTKAAHARVSKAGLAEPATLHPKIDLLGCIGCGSCVKACPEDVLGIVDGKATIVHGSRCVGHALCAEVCPVGAITMGFGTPRRGFEIPVYDEHLQSNVPGLYIAGELGGVGLIKNAIEQGTRAVRHAAAGLGKQDEILIVGAGPAGIGAALAAKTLGLRPLLLEQDDLGGSILHYPRRKLVLTDTVDIPLYGKLKASEISKEELLRIFTSIVDRHGLTLRTQQKVDAITRTQDGRFEVRAGERSFSGGAVILAIGRRGSPRKLGVPGEELPKVAYRLIDAETVQDSHVLVVGGGDSAVEAAVALARQKGNTVTLSYRKAEFVRLKEKNLERVTEMTRTGAVVVHFNSEVAAIRERDVVLRAEDGERTLPNDLVYVFAGGELPAELLERIGVRFRSEESA